MKVIMKQTIAVRICSRPNIFHIKAYKISVVTFFTKNGFPTIAPIIDMKVTTWLER